MVKKIEMPDIRGIIVREPINIDEPIFLEDHLPYPSRPRGAAQNAPVINYPKVDLRAFLETIRQCTEITELTPAIVNRLIQRIEVHKSEKIDGRKRVRLDVYFTAVGLINIPDEKELFEMMQEIQSAKSA